MKHIKHFIHRIAGWVYFKTMSVCSLEKSNNSLKEALLAYGIIDPYSFKKSTRGSNPIKNGDDVRQLVVKDADFKIQLSRSDVEAMGVKIIK